MEELERAAKVATALRDDNGLLENKLLSQGEALTCLRLLKMHWRCEFERDKVETRLCLKRV
jgi:hypothetical protein